MRHAERLREYLCALGVTWVFVNLLNAAGTINVIRLSSADHAPLAAILMVLTPAPYIEPHWLPVDPLVGIMAVALVFVGMLRLRRGAVVWRLLPLDVAVWFVVGLGYRLSYAAQIALLFGDHTTFVDRIARIDVARVFIASVLVMAAATVVVFAASAALLRIRMTIRARRA